MKSIQKSTRILSLLCACLMLLSALTACTDKQSEPETEPTTTEANTQAETKAEGYSLLLTDGLGNPVYDVIVKVLQNGEQVKMYPYKGELLTMDLEEGTYQLELDLFKLEGTYSYDESLCALTPEKKSTSIRLFRQPEAMEEALYVGNPISKDYNAVRVETGSYQVSLTPDDYSFLVFYPNEAAVYTVTYECDTDLSLSYHGSTFFVQGNDLTEGSKDIVPYENGLSVSVYASNLGGSYVFAIKSASATSCILNIRNAGLPGTRVEDMPWSAYLEDSAKVAEQLQLSANAEGTYTPVDVTDMTLSAVYNEADGYYHMGSANGPLLFISLTEENIFISSIRTICANQRMGLYLYDDSGAVKEKRSYNELFHQYGMPTDADTVLEAPIRVPMTAKLAEAIQKFGEKSSWWSATSESNLFTQKLMGSPYNQAYAWLLFCGYYA